MDAISTIAFVIGAFSVFGVLATIVGRDTRDDFDHEIVERHSYVRPLR